MRVRVVNHPTMGQHCVNAFRELGHEVQFYDPDEEEKPDLLFCITANPQLMELAATQELRTIVWIVDHPDHGLLSRHASSPFVHLFHFDPLVTKDLKQRGLERVTYMPPGADTRLFGDLAVSAEDQAKYAAPISFVGNPGSDCEYNLYQLNRQLSSSQIEDMESCFRKMLDDRSLNCLPDLVDSDWIAEIESRVGSKLRSHPLMSSQEMYQFLIGRKFVEVERIHLVQLISQHFDCALYGESEQWNAVGVKDLDFRGFVDHCTEMPKVFRCSNINLNINRRFFPSGLPMRVFDVMASRGFLLTNPQPDLDHLFSEGSEFASYDSDEDLLKKIRYYLDRPDERKAIASAAFESVQKSHQYHHRISQMLEHI